MKIKSMRGSGGECSKFRPKGPHVSCASSVVVFFRVSVRLFSPLRITEESVADEFESCRVSEDPAISPRLAAAGSLACCVHTLATEVNVLHKGGRCGDET